MTIPVTVYQVRCYTCVHKQGQFLILVFLYSWVMQIALHVAHYNSPELQRHVVRITLMVPIYAMVSWFSLRWSSCRKWLSPARECYEAVVLYSFYRYLIACLEVKTGDFTQWMENLPPQNPLPPLTGRIGALFHVKPIEKGRDFMHAMRRVCTPQVSGRISRCI